MGDVLRLTVIMAVHNAMPFLPDALTSITSQTYDAFTLVIVDDGSTDGSSHYLKTLSDERVTLITLPRRSGQGAARNVALARCASEYTAFMDADDVSLPTRLERQVQFLDENRDVGIVGTKVSYIGDSGRKGFSPPLALVHDEIRSDLLKQRNALVNATLMFRTKTLERSGGYRIDGAGEDFDWFLRITELTCAANLDEILYLYRLHKNSTNAVRAGQLALRYAHACECARIRCAGGVETSFEDFCHRRQERPLWQRWAEQLDYRALAYYREALEHILNGSPWRGYSRLILAAAVSPRRLGQRARRATRAAKPIAKILGMAN